MFLWCVFVTLVLRLPYRVRGYSILHCDIALVWYLTAPVYRFTPVQQ